MTLKTSPHGWNRRYAVSACRNPTGPTNTMPPLTMRYARTTPRCAKTLIAPSVCICDKLTSTGQLDNTIVIFSSDHGEMLGDHGRWGKIVPYHPSAGVPLTVAGPGIARGTTSAALVSHIDLTATCLDYAGIPIPQEMDCLSLRPVLESRSKVHREVLFSGLGAWRMAFDGEYKAITGFNPSLRQNSPDWTVSARQIHGVAPLVFDRANDPGENTDLYTARPARGERLLEMLAANAAESTQQEKNSAGESD